MEKLRNALANTLAKPMKVMFGLVAVAALGACAGGPAETSRNAPATLASDQLLAAPAPSSYNIRSVVVDVPRTLAVSESNRFYPGGDIVWREDPFGDRHAQVEAIVQNAMTQGVARLPKGTVSADLHIEVTRFHALTQRARATVGGVHAIQFLMSLRDPVTGKTFGPTKLVKADLKAFGGNKAIEAEMRGETQKVRITNHLMDVLHAEMTQPQGFVAENLGLIGAINQL